MANPRDEAAARAPGKASLWTLLLCQAYRRPLRDIEGIEALIGPQTLFIWEKINAERNFAATRRPGKV